MTSRIDLSLKMMFFIGESSPFVAARFRLVNYSNLPRYDLPSGDLTLDPGRWGLEDEFQLRNGDFQGLC